MAAMVAGVSVIDPGAHVGVWGKNVLQPVAEMQAPLGRRSRSMSLRASRSESA